MKKYAGYMIAGIIGFLLAIPATSFGAQINSLINKKITNEYAVVVEGKTLPKKSIAVDGTSYIPARSFAETFGYDIKFENNTINFSKPGGDAMTSSAGTVLPEQSDTTDQFKLDRINDRIAAVKGDIWANEAALKDPNNKLPDDERARFESIVTEYKKQLADLEKQKTELEVKLNPAP